ncbi:MAG TPA: M23 family metallopeptidase [Thermoanaerobaculia bacterium]|nr:M23 family metallopeptidase [Thermoanaerobaculia bacterium]
MRIAKVLIAGWLAGGTFIVLISVLPGAQTVAKPLGQVAQASGSQLPVGRGSSPAPGPIGPIVIPVLGITPTELRDNFEQVRGGGRIHHALDIMAPRNTPVVAAVDGTVRKLFTSKGGGLTIYQFDRAEERVYYYAHLERYADGIGEGLFVAQGTVIGYVGTSGNAAPDAPHLHFSVEVLPPTKEWWKGEPLNPYPLLTTRASVLP